MKLYARFTMGNGLRTGALPLRGVGGGILHAAVQNRWAKGNYPRTHHRLLKAAYAALRRRKKASC